MRVLMVTNKVRTYALGFQNSIDPLQSLGHEVVWAADFSQFTGNLSEIPCRTEQISIHTWPFKKCNITACKKILRIIKDERIDGVICSTPIGGFVGRIAARIRNVKPVVYWAHGFLFFKGAPLINRTLYKLEEILLARYTDALITITREDFLAAQKFKLRSGRKPYLVHGAGVKVGVCVSEERSAIRMENNIPQDAFVIISAGELNKNKNTQIPIRAIAEMHDSNVHYLVCGVGEEQVSLSVLARELGVADRIHFLGYRLDVAKLMSASDVFVMSSYREGLPRAMMEAMDLSLPCVGSRIRGIADLIDEGGRLSLRANRHSWICKGML